MTEKIEAIIFDWVGTLYQFASDGIGLFPYSERVLQELQGKYRMTLVSKAVSDNVENRNRQINPLRKYFDQIIVDTEKTDEQFRICIREMKSKPENTLVVDDRVDRGIQIGNKIGCQTAWIQKGKYADTVPNAETGEPTYRINSIEDLLEILK